jgi:hypothetical protein
MDLQKPYSDIFKMIAKILDKITTPIFYTCNAIPLAGVRLSYSIFGHTQYFLPVGYGAGLGIQAGLAKSAALYFTDNPKIATIAMVSALAVSPISGIAKLATYLATSFSESKSSSLEDICSEDKTKTLNPSTQEPPQIKN